MHPAVPLVFGMVLMSGYVRTAQSAAVTDGSQKLMLLLLDGFRWDYVDKYNLENFRRFHTQGVRAQNTQSVFPSLSFPNYYSITTGLYPENHGILGNMMYDVETGGRFVLDHNPGHLNPAWWNDAWPIWVSVEKQGKSAYMYRWRGPEVAIHGTHPRWYIPYSGIPTTYQFKDATINGLEVLRNGSADFVGIYHEDPDHYGHVNGPDSPNLGAVLVGVDKIVGQLLDRVQGLEPHQKINLMIVSDHGMTSIDRSKVINVTSILTPDLYTTIIEDNALCLIFLSKPRMENKVYRLLSTFHPNMTVYRRHEVPDRYHWKQGGHVPDITCVADLGWSILHPLKPDFFANSETGFDMKGTHGYDTSLMDMRGIFYGIGPYFKRGASVESILIVDLYNVMCDILAITPMPNNGTVQHMEPLLAGSRAPGSAVYGRGIIRGHATILLSLTSTLALWYAKDFLPCFI